MKKTHLWKSRRAMRVVLARRDGEGGDSNSGGGGNGGSGGNNQSGNSGGSNQQQNGNQNNDGQGFDLQSFWSSPSSESGNSSGNGNPSESNQSGGGTGNQNQQQQQTPVQALGQELGQMISGFNLAAPVFNAEVGEQIAAGNFDGVNQLLQQNFQASLQTNLKMVAKLLSGFKADQEQRFQARLDEVLNSRDNNASLESLFPELVGNPALRPQIESVFNKALEHSKNDRKKAGDLARDMLKLMGTELNRSLNDPGNGHGDQNNAGTQSLLESLISGT